jgi:hypothetical protein
LNNELKWIIIASVISLVLIAGMVGASKYVEDYTKTKELKEVNSKELCEKESEMNVTKKQCKEEDKDRKIKLKDTHIQIDILNNSQGSEVLKIYAK